MKLHLSMAGRGSFHYADSNNYVPAADPGEPAARAGDRALRAVWKAAAVSADDATAPPAGPAGPVEPVEPAEPPVAERRPVAITAHGDTRTDDWFWVRDIDDPAVMELLEAENAHTAAATEHLEGLIDDVYGAMLARIQLTDVSYPAPRGEWAYYLRTVEGEEHSLSCRRPASAPLPSPDPRERDEHEVVLLDENEMAKGFDYFAVESTALSHDQRLLAYAVDTTGSERLVVRVRDLERGEDLPDVIEDTYYSLAFARNGTLFYTRPDSALRPHQIWRHTLGSDPSADVLVWEEPDEHFFLGLDTTKDGEYIALRAASNVTAELRLIPAERAEAEPVVVAPRQHGVTYSIEHHHGEIIVLSNEGAENFMLFRVPLDQLGRENWQVLMPERPDVRLEAIDVVDGYVLVEERGHATTSVRIVPLGSPPEAGSSGPVGQPGSAGFPGRVIEAPDAGAVFLGTNLDFHSTEVRFETTSLITPVTLQSLDLETGTAAVLRRQPAPGYEPDRYLTSRQWATSADGTKVPVTLAWARDRPPGPGPCVLYGYGSYEISTDPTFRIERPIHPLLDRGVVYAIAHVRGGGELGRRWYLDGKLANKPHTFEDFVAVGRHLVEEGWTSPSQLAALGGSAGGLLMGASVNLAPDLFAGIVAEVPFVDCLTTMLDPSLPLTVIEQEEWGDPVANEADYWVIKSYAPYDNVRAQPYPRMLVTSGLNDPRVGYFEPTKWVQKLRAAHPDNARSGRVMLRMELSAGHGGPSGRYQLWRKRAFLLAFVLECVGRA
ncbi:MAG TPA: prolyl oligopeptidase family serine peptidase [Acidimicrobiales bacterium]|nr:prolyl oligopeptidase family serine peptidase [Acidimicrobiales bacterium]